MKKALITGITGQDGSYLADFLLARGDYEVHGLVRRSSQLSRSRIDHLRHHERLHLHYGDLTDGTSLATLVHTVRPDELYNLGAMSHVKLSFEMPDYTALTNATGTMRLLHAIHTEGLDCRFLQASSSEMFALAPPPLDERAALQPRSPYGSSKVQAHWMTINHREAYGMFAVSAIAFNHESPRRGENFVTRKITKAVAAIEAGIEDHVELGNLDAVRDWGYAPEYVRGMWLMLQQDEPEDYVLATGVGHTVRDFCEAAFAHAGLRMEDHVKHNDTFERPVESHALIGDPSRIADRLGWRAETTAMELAGLMVEADRADVERLIRSETR